MLDAETQWLGLWASGLHRVPGGVCVRPRALPSIVGGLVGLQHDSRLPAVFILCLLPHQLLHGAEGARLQT